MKFIEVTKVLQSKFITRYDLTFETKLGNKKVYEMISRRNDIQTIEDIRDSKSDAVVMIMLSEDKNSILLNKEYRMPIANEVFSFPAGLIDSGETIEEAATRELREETGLELIKINEIWPKAYSAVGLTNELTTVVVGIARGDFCESSSDEEEIEASWYTKEEVKKLLETRNFAARTQAYCMLWSMN